MGDTSQGRSYTQVEEEQSNVHVEHDRQHHIEQEQGHAPVAGRTTATEEAASAPAAEQRMSPEDFYKLAERFSQMQQGPQQQGQSYPELRGRGFVPNDQRGKVWNVVKYMADERSGALDRNVQGQQMRARESAFNQRTSAGMAGDYLQHLDRGNRGSTASDAQQRWWNSQASHLDELTRHGVTRGGHPMDLSAVTGWDKNDNLDLQDALTKIDQEIQDTVTGLQMVSDQVDDKESAFWNKIPIIGKHLPGGIYNDPSVPQGEYEPRTISQAESLRFIEQGITSLGVNMARRKGIADELALRGVQVGPGYSGPGVTQQMRDQVGQPQSAPDAATQPRDPSQVPGSTIPAGQAGVIQNRVQVHVKPITSAQDQQIAYNATEDAAKDMEGEHPGVNPTGTHEPTAAAQGKPTYRTLIENSSAKYGVDPRVIAAMIQVESGFDPKAKSPKGAVGLAQFMPETAGDYGLAGTTGDSSFDRRGNPVDSVDAMARHYASLKKEYPDQLDLRLQAYNAGSGRVKGSLAGGKPLVNETIEYPDKVREVWDTALERAAKYPFDASQFGMAQFGVQGGGGGTSSLGSVEEGAGPAVDRKAADLNSTSMGYGPRKSKEAQPLSSAQRSSHDFSYTHAGPKKPLSIPSADKVRSLDPVSRFFYSYLSAAVEEGADISSVKLQNQALDYAYRNTQQPQQPQQQVQRRGSTR